MPGFHYDPYQNAQAGSIADLMARRGDIAAQGARASGDVRARAAEGIGGAISGSLGEISRYMQQAPLRQMQALQLHGAQQAANDDQLLRQALSMGDLGKATEFLKSQGGVGIVALQKLTAMATQEQERTRQLQEQHDDDAGEIGYRIAKGGNTIDAAQNVLGDAVQRKRLAPDEATQIQQTIASDPSKIPTLARELMARSKTFRPLLDKVEWGKPGEVALDPLTHQPIAGASIPAKKPDYTINGQRFSGTDGTPIGAAVPPQHPPQPKSIESKNVLLNGKPAIVNFNPATGVHTLPDGTDVSTRVTPIPPASTQVNVGQQNDAKSIADAIVNGEQPPDVKGLYRFAGPVRAELAKQGFDLTKANLDWEATKKHLATMNGTKVTTMRSAVATATESLDVIDDLASQWNQARLVKDGKLIPLNKAELAAAKNGLYGAKAQSIATQLEGQITDVVSELGQVYMGGNSPTDHALKLAEKNLSGAWAEQTLHDMTKLARTNLRIRNNSILHSGAVLSDGPAAATAPASEKTTTAAGPDLHGLMPGHGRTFSEGPYKGQTWTIGPDGKPMKVGG